MPDPTPDQQTVEPDPLHEQMAQLAHEIDDDDVAEHLIHLSAQVRSLEREAAQRVTDLRALADELLRAPHTDRPLIARVVVGRRLRAVLAAHHA